MRLLLVISSLGPGGAEKVLTSLANSWADCGWTIFLLTFDTPASIPHYTLSPRVTRLDTSLLGVARNPMDGVKRNLARVLQLRRHIRTLRPDRILSFMDDTNLLVLMAGAGLGIPIVVSERTDPSSTSRGRPRSALRRLLYPTASRVIVQTQRALRPFSWLPGERLVVIPNSVTIPEQPSRKADNICRFIAVGRLSREKGPDLLLEAFAQVHRAYPDVRLEILGEGSMRQELEKLRDHLGITQAVHLPGLVPDPGPHMDGAFAFILPSRQEGFPNVLLEAMAAGLATIATDCPSGPAEIIQPEVNGLLVPAEDPEALAKAMIRLIREPQLRQSLGNAARKSVEKYDPDQIRKQWELALAFGPAPRPSQAS